MRRLLLALTGALALPVLVATPAYAADNVICVNTGPTGCNQTVANIQLAITAAGSNGLADTILVGAGVYNDGPYTFSGSAESLTLKGAGQGQTVITLPPSASIQTYVNATSATVQALSILMAGGANSNDMALQLTGGTADHVTIDGTTTVNAKGITSSNGTIVSSSIDLPASNVSGSRAIFSSGNTTVSDTDMTANQGHVRSGAGPADKLSRVSIRADYQAIAVDSGTVDVDDTFINLGASNGTGLAALNNNPGTTAKTINADHVTIVGGSGGSIGAHAYAAAPTVSQVSTLNLSNSIIRGPQTSLRADAGNNGSLPVSTATVNVSYTDYQTTGGTIDGTTGAGGITEGPGNVNVDPQFVDASAGEYALKPGSPVVDKGNPAPGGPATDLNRAPRIVDGDAIAGAVRDMGAFELQDTTAPDTTITGGPTGATADATPTFTFTSEPGATFECKVDTAAYAVCASPFTTGTLAEGGHTVAVRAKDAVLNADPTPATRTFTVDTFGPTTTFKKKPAKLVFGGTVKFKFEASEPGARFTCSIDGGKAKACQAKKSFKVGLGKHKVKVFATDAVGNQGKAVKYSFTRVKPCSGEC